MIYTAVMLLNTLALYVGAWVFWWDDSNTVEYPWNKIVRVISLSFLVMATLCLTDAAIHIFT